MNVVACRVDERLVHGQVMTSWSKHLQLKRIVIVDDQVAKDDFMATVLTMSAPAGITIEILSVKDLQADKGEEKTLLLFKRIPAALELTKELEETPVALTELNVGNVGSVPGRVQVTKNVFLSEDEKNDLRELQSLGVNVFLQMLYTDPQTSVNEILK